MSPPKVPTPRALRHPSLQKASAYLFEEHAKPGAEIGAHKKVSAVRKLIDRTDWPHTLVDPAQLRVPDLIADRLRESSRAEYSIGPLVERHGAGIQVRKDAHRVVHAGNGPIGCAQVALTIRPGVVSERCAQKGSDFACAIQARKGGTEPFTVWRVAPFEEKAHAHDVADQSRRIDTRPDFIAALIASSRKCLFLAQPNPLRCE